VAPDRGAVVLADDQIALPVTGYGPVLGLGRALRDVDHVRDAASTLNAAAGPTLSPAGAETAVQLPAQLAPALDEQRLVDGLVAHPHHRIVGELEPQPAGDLLRRPPFLQPLGD